MRRLIGSVAAVLMTCLAVPAAAEATADYPSRLITLIVPFAPGGTSATLGNLIGERLGQRLNQKVVVMFRPGATGNIGSQSVATADPDGYTLLLGTIATHGINPSIYKKMPYDHIKDFVPVSNLGSVPNILFVNPALPVKTVPELIAYLKSKPGKLNYASPGVGASNHMASELLKMMSNTDMKHIAYKGSGPAMQDVIAGHVEVMFDNSVSAWPQIRAGRVRALGVATPERLKSAPDLPAIAEFLPGFAVSAWYGLFAPAKTPPAIVEKISAAVRDILKESSVAASLERMDFIAAGGTPAEFANFVQAETDRWKTVVDRIGLEKIE